jgi:hypothetical protein
MGSIKWEERLSSDKDFLNFLEQFFIASDSQKYEANTVRSMENVDFALSHRWDRVDIKLPTTMESNKAGISRENYLYTDVLARPFNAYISEWSSVGAVWKANAQTNDWIRKYIAEATEALLKSNYEEEGMRKKQVLQGDILGKAGVCPCLVKFNPHKGKIRYRKVEQPVVDEEGVPVLDEAEQPVVELVDMPYREGMVETELINPRHFFPDPYATPDRSPRAVIIAERKPLQWLIDQYGQDVVDNIKSVKGQNSIVAKVRSRLIPSASRAELSEAWDEDWEQKEDQFTYIRYYEAPSVSNPQGRYTTCANFREILTDEPLTNIYDSGELGELPFVIYFDSVPKEGHGLWTESRFLAALDSALLDMKLKTMLVQHATDSAFSPIPIPQGAIDIDTLINSQGTYVEYIQSGDIPPPSTWSLPRPAVLNDMFSLWQANKQEVEDKTLFGEVDYGNTPKSVRAASAIAMLQNTAQGHRKGMGDYNESEDFKLARHKLVLMGQFYENDRLKRVLGNRKDNILMILEAVGKNWKEEILDCNNITVERGIRENKESQKQEALHVMGQMGERLPPDMIPYLLKDVLNMPFKDEALQKQVVEDDTIFYEIATLLFSKQFEQAVNPISGEPEFLPTYPGDDHARHIYQMRLAMNDFKDMPEEVISQISWSKFHAHLKEHIELQREEGLQALQDRLAMMGAERAYAKGGAFTYNEKMQVVQQESELPTKAVGKEEK